MGLACRTRSLLAVATLLAGLLAGCADTPTPLAASTGIEADLAGGTIIGFVIDTEAAPVIGAIAATDGAEPVLTDDAGRFVIQGLGPGSRRVEVQALGYASAAREVAVDELEPVEVRFVLQPIAIETPRIEVLIFKGFSQCDYMLWVTSGRLGPPCDSGQAKSQFKVHVAEQWQFLVSEMKWKGGVGNYDSFRLFHADDGDCVQLSPCYGLVYGRGYARVEGEPGKTELVKHYDPWADGRGPPYPDNGSFDMMVNGQWIGALQPELNGPVCQAVLQAATGSAYKPGCLGVGVSTGIPYDLYVSIFHSMQPDDRGACCPSTKYTAVPDG